MDLDIKFLGTSLRMPSWSLLVLGAPAPEKIGQVLITESARASMNFDANWGLVLKVGDRAFEDESYKEKPYKPGDWIMFEDFHPESRLINGLLVYFIPDSRVIAALDDPETFEPYLNFKDVLPGLESQALELRKSLIERSNNECR